MESCHGQFYFYPYYITQSLRWCHCGFGLAWDACIAYMGMGISYYMIHSKKYRSKMISIEHMVPDGNWSESFLNQTNHVMIQSFI